MTAAWRLSWERHGARWSAAAVLAAALVASLAGLDNGFALDDVLLLERDELLHSLADPWRLITSAYWRLPPADTLWRPWGMLTLATQWVAGGGSPLVYHAVSVALYAAVSLLLLGIARTLLAPLPALAAGLVFAVHPVHVESVGNVIGQLELFVAAAVLAAVLLYLRARQRGRLGLGTSAAIAACLVVGLGFKEHAVVLPVLLLALEATVLRDAPPLAPPAWSRVRLLHVILFAVVAAWILVRSDVIGGGLAGDWPHRALRGLDAGDRAWVMLGLLPELARLMLWPARLYVDYSPQFVPVLAGPAPRHLLSLIVLACWAALLVRSWRRDRVLALALLWVPLALLPVSNVIIPSGILLAERTLFLASVGAALFAGALAAHLAPLAANAPGAARTLVAAAGAGLVLVAAAQSSERQHVWRDNSAVITSLLVDAPTNYRGHLWYGDSLMRAGDRIGGERALRRALALWPAHDGALLLLAVAYQNAGLCDAAMPLYRRAIELEPLKPAPRFGLGGCYMSQRRYSAARRTAVEATAQVSRSLRAFNITILLADSALAATDTIRPNNRWLHRRRGGAAGR